MKILVPKSGDSSNLTVSLSDGYVHKDIDNMLQFPQVDFLLNDNAQYTTYDATVDYEVGTVVHDTTSSTGYKALQAKSDTNDYWIEIDTFFFNDYTYTTLNKVATLYSSTAYYHKQTFVFTETTNDNGADPDTYTYTVYMTPLDGVYGTTDTLQLVYQFTVDNQYTGNNLKIAVTNFPSYHSSNTIKRGFIFDITIKIVDKATGQPILTDTVPFKSLVDNPTSTPLAGNALEWEQLPYYGQLAMFDYYMNTKYTLPSYTGYHYTFTDSDMDAIAVLGITGDTAKLTWTNSSTSVEEDIRLHDRVVSNFMEYYFTKFNQQSIIYSSKALTNIDSVKIQLDGEKVSTSTILVGKEYDIGKALYGYQKRSRDFSKKTTTKSGYDSLVAGKKANTYIVKLIISNDKADEVFDLLQSLSTTLVLYLLEDGSWIYGWYKDLYMTKSNPVLSDYNLEINGVI